MTPRAVLHYALNTAGRDFVVGDLHGCFDALRSQLVVLGFDTTRDRLFSVGDLVDRGPKCEEALDWLAEPWFHAVRGNHEQMAIGVARGKHDLGNYLVNGGGWFLRMETTDQQRYAEAFDALPYALDIETKSGLVGIVHAECAGNSWTEFCAALEAPGSNTKLRHTTEVALWARSRMQAHEMGFPVAPITGLAYLVVGHTPVLTANRLANIAYIDTGAVFGRSLTVLPLDALSTLPMMQATRIDTRTNMDMLVGNEP